MSELILKNLKANISKHFVSTARKFQGERYRAVIQKLWSDGGESHEGRISSL